MLYQKLPERSRREPDATFLGSCLFILVPLGSGPISQCLWAAELELGSLLGHLFCWLSPSPLGPQALGIILEVTTYSWLARSVGMAVGAQALPWDMLSRAA